jgi:tRNA modification GTPase
LLREGRVVVLAGRPNTGKSSLFNALAGAARAIVTDIPGTTRDLLTERIEMSGVPVTLVDTAGSRDAADAIEAEGVERATQAQTIAELVLVVLDGSTPLSDDDWKLLERTRVRPRRVVINKSDLPHAWHARDVLPGEGADAGLLVSAKTGEGLDELRAALVEVTPGQAPGRDAPSISNLRHIGLVERAVAALDRTLVVLGAGGTEEMLLVDLTEARQALEEVRGRRTPEDVLRHIFSRFCIGK